MREMGPAERRQISFDEVLYKTKYFPYMSPGAKEFAEMSDQSQGLREDVAFMRSMAEQGRRGPFLGGIFLAAAGLIYGAASFLHWGIQTGHLPFAPGSTGNVWIGASLLFAVVWVVLFTQLRRGGQAAPGAAQFAFAAVWIGAGIGIVVMVAAVNLASAQLHDPALLNINAFTTFAFYGAAWSVCGALARQRWMYLIAAAAFVLVPALAFVSGTASELLVLGSGLLVTLFAPGVKLMLQAPR
jgi:hypothetical protein